MSLHRRRLSHQHLGEQLCLSLLPTEERPGLRAQGGRLGQNVSLTRLRACILPQRAQPCQSLMLGSALPFSDLGVHVDGFIANVAHTFVVGVAQVGGLL